MKLTVIIVALLSFAVSTAARTTAVPFILVLVLGYSAYGVLLSARRQLDWLNDTPNAFRVALAAIGGYVTATPDNFLFASSGIFLVVSSILLNDEYQRRSYEAIRTKRRGGSIALLGVDGSGKSTHAAALEKWFVSRGYYCTVVPFHRYLFVEILARGGAEESRRKPRERNPLRPLLSLFDNMLLNLITSFGSSLEGRVVIYDRYIWSTFVKYNALDYPVRPLRALYLLPRPKYAFILDVPVIRSLAMIHGRADHIKYSSQVLAQEKEEYLRIARLRGHAVLDSSRDFDSVQRELEMKLAYAFPQATRGR